MAKNPYTVLGVSENATDDEIRNAYRKLAKQYHPDLNPNDPVAAQKMNDVNVAYDQIKTAEKRAAFRAEQAQSNSYRPGNNDPFSSYYNYGNFSSQYYNHNSGNGYYGGSYTGRPQEDNEPPFGWDSVFGSEDSRKQFFSLQVRLYRFLRYVFIVLMLLSLGRCICAPLFYAQNEPDVSSTERTVISKNFSSDEESLDKGW